MSPASLVGRNHHRSGPDSRSEAGSSRIRVLAEEGIGRTAVVDFGRPQDLDIGHSLAVDSPELRAGE